MADQPPSAAEILAELIRRPSVTPQDAGCQAYFTTQLQPFGFDCIPLRFGQVDNLWARRGDQLPLLVLAGHTDVVPPGDLAAWHSEPFTPSVRDGKLYGRGAADMKGGLAAMLAACQRFVLAHPSHRGSLAWLLTSDEEGPAVNGTAKVVEWLQHQGQHMDWCIVGEPSSVAHAGDQIKNGRRGSLNGRLMVHGVQGHVAYPHLADNPIHRFAPALLELSTTEWDRGNEFFPPTSLQFVQLQAGMGVTNVIPGQLSVWFNFRHGTASPAQPLQTRVETLLQRHGLQYTLEWEISAQPFVTTGGELLEAAQAAVAEICGFTSELSTSGGTSDARFIAPTGTQVLELGLVNATIHKVNECIDLADLALLTQVYQRILEKLLLP